MEQERRRQREEHAVVLDFLQNGYPFDKRPSHIKTPIVHAIGKTNFTLLELVPKPGVVLQPHAEVYIGEDKRDQIHHINGKLPLHKLTATAQSELPHIIANIVRTNEARFVEFFNKASPLSVRMHVVELLPGVGKKHMHELIEARDERPFESFQDLRNRVKLFPDPEKTIVRRIIEEISEQQKHPLFVVP
ncbi:MAG TPA: DUF655 domain-containing protein [Candidatus Nanoarchaeia archaeon]|nr:DUF655 domain-containing protein [Candidatus Nanoarchaeia archaeon]